MAQAMQYLIEESVSIFHDRIMDMASGGKSNGSKASSTKSQIFSESNATWREILAIFKNLQGADGQFVHPKMKKLGEVVEHHFSRSAIAAIEDEEAHWVSGKGVDGEPPRSQHETRVMVFCSLREGVNEIVNYLNSGGFKATPFIGQASDTKGNRGFTQKQQEEVRRFRIAVTFSRTLMNFFFGVFFFSHRSLSNSRLGTTTCW